MKHKQLCYLHNRQPDCILFDCRWAGHQSNSVEYNGGIGLSGSYTASFAEAAHISVGDYSEQLSDYVVCMIILLLRVFFVSPITFLSPI